jgi:hypothetical protein
VLHLVSFSANFLDDLARREGDFGDSLDVGGHNAFPYGEKSDQSLAVKQRRGCPIVDRELR